MIYSNACSYAIVALSRLVMLRPDGYVLMEELCAGTDLPRHFVAKIFQDLVRKGLLISAKGRGGGFALGKKPVEITLYEIMAMVDGVERIDSCVVGLSQCNDQMPCPLHERWHGIKEQLVKFLTTTTLQEMSDSMKSKIQSAGAQMPEAKSRSKPVRINI